MSKFTFIVILFTFCKFSLHAQDSTAVIHFYRTNSIKGAIVTYKLYQDSTLVGEIKPGTVIHLTAKPGVNKFTTKTESKEFIFINAKPGEEYYVKCSLAFGMAVGRPKFEIVSKQEGIAAIEKIESKKLK